MRPVVRPLNGDLPLRGLQPREAEPAAQLGRAGHGVHQRVDADRLRVAVRLLHQQAQEEDALLEVDPGLGAQEDAMRGELRPGVPTKNLFFKLKIE